MVRIVVTPVNSEDLQHGDLYSTHDQEWWDNRDSTSIGHFVVLRNSNPFPAGYEGRTSYKVTVEPDGGPSASEIKQLQIDDAVREEARQAAKDAQQQVKDFAKEAQAQGEEDQDEVITTG